MGPHGREKVRQRLLHFATDVFPSVKHAQGGSILSRVIPQMGRSEGKLSTADRFQKSMQRKDSAHDDIEIRKANPVPRCLASNLKKIHKSTLLLFTLAPKI